MSTKFVSKPAQADALKKTKCASINIIWLVTQPVRARVSTSEKSPH